MRHDLLFSTNLEYFAIAYRLRNIGEITNAIPISRQGLAKAIHTLEHGLGVSLFESETKGQLTPTVYADELYATVGEWFTSAGYLEQTLRDMSLREMVRIPVALPFGMLSILGSDFQSAFTRRNPGVEIDAVEYPDYMTTEQLEDGKCNIAILVAATLENKPFETEPFATSGDCAWINRNNPLSLRPELNLVDLDRQPVAIANVGGENPPMAYYRARFNELGIQLNPLLRTSDLYTCLLLALEGRAVGIGVSIGSDILSEKLESIAVVPLVDGYQWETVIAMRRGHVLTTEEHLVFDYLKECSGRVSQIGGFTGGNSWLRNATTG